MSVSSTRTRARTCVRSAIVRITVPPPTSFVGEEITCPTSTRRVRIVPGDGARTSVSSRPMRAFSSATRAATVAARVFATSSCSVSSSDWLIQAFSRSLSPRSSCVFAVCSRWIAALSSACDWSTRFRGVRGSMRTSICPAFTASPISAPSSRISPEAFDFTSTVETGSMVPDASTVTERFPRATVADSYFGAGALPSPQAAPSAATSATTASRSSRRMGSPAVLRITHDETVAKLDGSAGAVRDGALVRDEHDRVARAVQRVEEREDLGARRAVEVAGRLVREQEARVRDERARDRDTLALTARQLAGAVRAALREPHALEGLARAPVALAGADARVDQRHLDVRERRLPRQQRKGLEDEADVAVPHVRELELGELRHEPSAEPVATGVRRVEAAEQVHERRLPAAGGTHDRDIFALPHDEVDSAQRLDR